MSTMTMLDYIDQEQETLTKILTEYDFSADTQLAEMNTVTILSDRFLLQCVFISKVRV